MIKIQKFCVNLFFKTTNRRTPESVSSIIHPIQIFTLEYQSGLWGIRVCVDQSREFQFHAAALVDNDPTTTTTTSRRNGGRHSGAGTTLYHQVGRDSRRFDVLAASEFLCIYVCEVVRRIGNGPVGVFAP